jgi:predicted transposase YbfD/YdcC
VEVALVPFGSLLAALAEVRDPRRAQGQRYSMRHLLLFSVLAVLTGATSYQGIITFIDLQRDRLNTVFGASFRRAPAVNTLRHLFLALGRDDLEAAFRRHARGLSARATPEAMRTIALDGKTLRGSFDHLNDSTAAHVLSAFASDAALILAHRELTGAPDEILAVPRLITELGLTGVLFTADALHCQKEGFAQAAETGNALLVRVKDNQPTLHAALAELCAEQHPFSRDETVDRRRHGRQEHRRVEVFDTAGQLDAPWQPLIACVARVSRLTYTKDTRSGFWPTREEIGYYACQIRRDAKSLAQAIRAHWGIENRDHYVRDVTLGEDGSRIRNRPGVMARIRSVALNILRANGVQNVSQALYANALNFDRLLALGFS